MKRHLVVALAALVVLPQLAAAQDGMWGARIRVTPVVSITPGFKQIGEATVSTSDGISIHDYDVHFAHGYGIGASAQIRMWNRFGLTGSALLLSRDEGELIDYADQIRYEIDGSNQLVLSAGLTMSLREFEQDLQLRRLNASIHAGPAIFHDRPKTESFTPLQAGVPYTYVAANIGAEAEMPFANNKMAFVVGIDDYMIMWDDDNARGRVEGYMQWMHPGATVGVETERSHMWTFRAGLSWRFF